MTIPKINSSHGSDTRNVINHAIEVTNEQGKAIQDLVAKGQLTPTQYATLIQSVNGLISKGSVTTYDLDKNNFEIDQTMISDSLRKIITGDTPINAVPADNSLTTKKYVNGSVTKEKLSTDVSGNLNDIVHNLALYNNNEVVDEKDIKNLTSVSSDGVTGNIRINSTPSPKSGSVKLHANFSKPSTVVVLILENQSNTNNFREVSRENVEVTSGVNAVDTNLIIKENQYVGIISENNLMYKVVSEVSYSLANTDIKNYKTFNRLTQYTFGFYYQIIPSVPTLERISKDLKSLEQKVNPDGDVIEYIKSHLNGKKIYMFGDSITFWDKKNASYISGNPYIKGLGSWIEERLGAVVTNHGVGGYRSHQVSNQIENTDLSNVYALTYSAGTNDPAYNTEVGTVDDLTTGTTFSAHVKRGIENAYTQNPSIRIYIITPHQNFSESRYAKDYAKALVDIGKYYGIPVFNAYETLQVNKVNYTAYLANDKLHFTNKGYQMFADGLIPLMANH